MEITLLPSEHICTLALWAEKILKITDVNQAIKEIAMANASSYQEEYSDQEDCQTATFIEDITTKCIDELEIVQKTKYYEKLLPLEIRNMAICAYQNSAKWLEFEDSEAQILLLDIRDAAIDMTIDPICEQLKAIDEFSMVEWEMDPEEHRLDSRDELPIIKVIGAEELEKFKNGDQLTETTGEYQR